MNFLFPYFSSNFLASFTVVGMPLWIFHLLFWKNFLSLFLNVLFCLYCLTLSQSLLNLHSFFCTFWFIASSCIICFDFLFSYFSFCEFPTIVSWWLFTGVFVTASPLTSPGLFPVFWPILPILLFRWSRFLIQFPTLLTPLPIVWGTKCCTTHQLPRCYELQ